VQRLADLTPHAQCEPHQLGAEPYATVARRVRNEPLGAESLYDAVDRRARKSYARSEIRKAEATVLAVEGPQDARSACKHLDASR
jgi:hypothetical protein